MPHITGQFTLVIAKNEDGTISTSYNPQGNINIADTVYGLELIKKMLLQKAEREGGAPIFNPRKPP